MMTNQREKKDAKRTHVLIPARWRAKLSLGQKHDSAIWPEITTHTPFPFPQALAGLQAAIQHIEGPRQVPHAGSIDNSFIKIPHLSRYPSRLVAFQGHSHGSTHNQLALQGIFSYFHTPLQRDTRKRNTQRAMKSRREPPRDAVEAEAVTSEALFRYFRLNLAPRERKSEHRRNPSSSHWAVRTRHDFQTSKTAPHAEHSPGPIELSFVISAPFWTFPRIRQNHRRARTALRRTARPRAHPGTDPVVVLPFPSSASHAGDVERRASRLPLLDIAPPLYTSDPHTESLHCAQSE